MVDIFSKAAKAAKQAEAMKQAKAVKSVAPVKEEVKEDSLSELSDKLQKSVLFAAFYAVYQKSGSLYNQASVEGLLTNISKALSDNEYDMFIHNVGLIAGALSVVQADIITPMSANDIIKQALGAAPDESPKEVLNKLISDKLITGADARRYLEHLLGW